MKRKTKPTIWTDFNLYLQDVHKRRLETHEDGHLITYDEISEQEVNENTEHFYKCWQAQMSAHKALLFMGSYWN